MTSRALQVASPVLVFALGAVVGAGGVGLASSATDPPLNLVAGNVVPVDFDPSADVAVAISVDIYNASDHDITALPTSIAGWSYAGDEPEAQVLPARSWTELVISALPDCDRVLTNVVVVEVNATRYQIVVGPRLAEHLSFVRQDYCGLERRLFLEPEVVSASIQDNALRMDLRLPAHGRTPVGEQLITNAGSPTPGFTVEVDGLPATLSADSPLALTASWRVQDCRPADEGAMHPGITFITDDGFVVESWIGEHAVALLARYAAIHCKE